MAAKNLILGGGKNLILGGGKNLVLPVLTVTHNLRGRHAVRNDSTQSLRGRHGTYGASAQALVGRHGVYNSVAQAVRGAHAVLERMAQALKGLARAANDALARYELYRGIDAAPDLDAAPWQTFTGASYDTPALDAAPGGTERTYHFVLRRRNAWDLVSRNIDEWTLTVDDTGAEVVTRPSAPSEFQADPAAGGTIRVRAAYLYEADGDDAAVSWLIYAEEGVDPDPDVDTPTVVSMSKVDGVAKLDWTSGAYGNGTVVHVLVRTRRVDAGPVNVDSTNLTAVTATADTSGPAAPDPAGIFFGDIAEQNQ